MTKGIYEKHHSPWNKGLKGEKYFKHLKNKNHLFKKAEDYQEILICKNCGIQFKRSNKIHYFCSVNCQSKFWIKNNKDRYQEFVKKWNKENKIKENRRKKRFSLEHPEITKAISLARQIKIPKGEICHICDNRLATQKHHEDYSKPFEVVFCCTSCHTKLNNERGLKQNG